MCLSEEEWRATGISNVALVTILYLQKKVSSINNIPFHILCNTDSTAFLFM